MKYISLWFSGDFQSYGSNSKSTERITEFFPTKSAIFGMICCSLGISGESTDFLKELNENIKIDIYDYSKNISLLNDYQIFGSGWNFDLMIPSRENGAKSQQVLNKHYLENSHFGIILKINNDNLFNKVYNGFKNPFWPLYLGRKCCIPNSKILIGSFDSEDSAINSFTNKTSDSFRKKITEDKIKDYSESKIINDVPIQFGQHKLYSSRRIYIKEYEETRDSI